MLTRELRAAVSVTDKAERRVRLSFSSEEPYLRSSWFEEPWIEVLGHAPGEIDMSRLASGAAPLLFGHDRFTREALIGVVERAWVENRRGYAEVRLSRRDGVDDIWQDIEDGILRNVSVGYQIHERTLVKQNENGPHEYRVTRWTPMEISLVPVPADATVGVGRAAERDRTEPARRFTITDLNDETCTMTRTAETPNSAPATSATLANSTVPANGAEPLAAERTRASEILDLVSTHGLPATLARDFIASGASLNDVRARVLEELVRRQSPESLPGRTFEGVGYDAAFGARHVSYSGQAERDLREAAIDGLLLRAGIDVAKPHPAARDVQRMSIHELARAWLSQRGVSTAGMGREALLRFAMSTSDFPAVLSGALNRAVRVGFEAEPASHTAWVRRTTVPDFKPNERAILGSAPDLLKVLEHGEYKRGNLLEDKATFTVEKFGRIIALSWEALVNDNLQVFLTIPRAFGQAARRKEADVVYKDLLLANGGAGQTMQDGKTLFHADHKNVTSSGSFNMTLLGAGRTLLRKQTTVGGGLLNLVPRYLIVPAELETDAEVLLAAATRHALSGASIEGTPTPEWIARLQLVVEARLPNNAAYLAADSSQVDVLELAYLEDEGGPTITERDKFDYDAREYKCRHVFGGRFLDWRGMVKMPIS